MPEVDYQKIGARLRDVREQRRCTQQDIADKVGVKRSTFHRIEQGNTKVTLDKLVQIVRILDVSMDYIVLGIRPQMNAWGLVLRSDDELEAIIAQQQEQP